LQHDSVPVIKFKQTQGQGELMYIGKL
jgi:hypothetical protein